MAISTDLRAQLLAIALTESEVLILENNGLDTEAALTSVTKEELRELGLSVGARNKIKAAYTIVEQGDSLQLQVNTEATVSAAPAAAVNQYAYLLGANSSSLGISAQALNPRIKPDFIRSAAQAASAFVMVGTGLCDIFTSKDFWQQLQLEDMELRSKINRWTENFRTERYISSEALSELGDGVSLLFGHHFQNLVSTSSKLSSQLSALQLMGNQARLDVGTDAAAYGQLQTLIPLAAEEISQRMISSPMPEMSTSLVLLLRDLLEILKDRNLQAAAGVTNATSADEGAILFLQRRLGSDIANRFRLALSYEQLLNALAACPQSADTSYLSIFGQIAGQVHNYYTAVSGGSTETTAAAVQRQSSAAPTQTSQTSFRFNFSLSLQIVRR